MERDLGARDRVGVQDAVLLENFTSEEAFIDNLTKRFNEDLIYTYIGSVLVSINPYKSLPIYGSEQVELYRNVNFYEVSPHVFALTDAALRSLRGEHRDQCLLITGESGSGKTEASKKVLQFIAATVTKRATASSVKDKLLQSNPVLEAFGNAKTNRNDNSSRFGKYMDVEFDFTGDPVGGHILNYLLEKSRVVKQAKGERNFHIFYQLLAGADDDLLSRLSLRRDATSYMYLNQGQSVKVHSIDDAADYRTVIKAMKVMELSDDEQHAMMVLVAVVIHLGELRFKEVNGQAELANGELVKTVEQLLGCPSSMLAKALLNRTIDARGDVVSTPLTCDEAAYARDALAKALYDRLFSWLVQRLNRSLEQPGNHRPVVLGILDIYGFEVFDSNSFEQLCINYCNEKLQQLFIDLTLRSEQDEYRREGIEWEPVIYFDNKIICDLIEEKHKGIISILDDECLRPGEASDLTFLKVLDSSLIEHPHYLSHAKVDHVAQKTMKRDEFKLVHYAGEVSYSVRGFLDKNNDLLYRDLKECMTASTNAITKELFTVAELNNHKRPDTASTQFKASLAKLMVILKSKEPSYIRCIKPNDDKMAKKLDLDVVRHQVKYLGLMENLRVRRAGFAYRRGYEYFLARYKSLCPATWPHPQQPAKEAVQLLVNHLKYGPEDYRMGNTKLFIRLPKTLFETEDAFQARKHELATQIQSIYKALLQRRRYVKMRNSAIVVQKWMRRWLAQRQAVRRRWAVVAVRAFVAGFRARNESENDTNRRFLSFVRASFLKRLALNLPTKTLDPSWPNCPANCVEASEFLKRLHRARRIHDYCTKISPPRRRQFELKILSESLFKGKKSTYAKSVGPWFVENRLSPEAQAVYRTGFESTKPTNEKVVYTVSVTKYDRHGYKPRDWMLVVTDTGLYLLDSKDGKTKHRLPFNSISGITVTKGVDNLLLIRIPENLEKDKGDLILACPFLIETLVWIIDTCDNRQLLNIEDASTINHSMIKGKPGTIDITYGTGQAIFKGKNGHLLVGVTASS